MRNAGVNVLPASGCGVLAALVALALGGCEPLLEEPSAKDLQREEQLVEVVEQALEDLETELEITESELDEVVAQIQTLDQEDLNTAIRSVTTALRNDLKPILPEQSHASAGSARGSGGVQHQQLTIDTTPPRVIGLTFNYRFSEAEITCADSVGVSVRFSEPVIVTGDLQLQLSVGSAERRVALSWRSDEPRRWLWFQYTPSADDEDADGISDPALVAGSIKDESQNDADRSLPTESVRHTSKDGSSTGNSHVPIDGSDAACGEGIHRSLGNLVDLLKEFRDEVTTENFFLHADAIDDALEETVEFLQDLDRNEFSDSVDEIVRILDELLQDLEQAELSDRVYRVVKVLDSRHARQLLTIIDLLRQIAEEGVEQVGEYRRQRTLELVNEVAEELDRLGSEEKLRRILYVTTERAPQVVAQELDNLGVGDTLSPVVRAVGKVIDEVADFIEERVL